MILFVLRFETLNISYKKLKNTKKTTEENGIFCVFSGRSMKHTHECGTVLMITLNGNFAYRVAKLVALKRQKCG